MIRIDARICLEGILQFSQWIYKILSSFAPELPFSSCFPTLNGPMTQINTINYHCGCSSRSRMGSSWKKVQILWRASIATLCDLTWGWLIGTFRNPIRILGFHFGSLWETNSICTLGGIIYPLIEIIHW